MIVEQFLLSEKYRPKKINDVILPERIKKPFRKFVKTGNIPNLLLQGGAGIGKTTIAKAAVEEMGTDWIFKNGSLDTNMDLLRTDITQFATTMSMTGKRKYVLIDEADYMQRHNVQPALRAFMEQYAKNCGFILTCNYPSRIIKELHSRLEPISFNISKDEKKEMIMDVYKRLSFIITEEGWTFDKQALGHLVKKYFPDFRTMLNRLQKYGMDNGHIDSGILANASEEAVDSLFEIIREKNFGDLRKWVALTDMEPHMVFRSLFDRMHEYLKPDCIPYLITVIADYQHKSSLVADQEINTLACLVTIMADADFK